MKKILITITVLLGLKGVSQQDLMVSQYMFNGLFLNPAYAGSHEYVSSTLLHRTQWVNYPGAPKTALLAVDGAIKEKNMGLGLIVSNDRIGATEQTDLELNYAYHLKFSKGKLAFGIKAGIANYILRSDRLTVWDESDNVFTGTKNAWLPKAGFGVYYYADRWYAGFSVPTLFAYDAKQNFSFDVNQTSFLRRHYYLNGGYIIPLNDKFKLKPSTLLKFEPSAPLQCDVNLNLLYNNSFWFGASYRTGDAVTFMVQYLTNFRLRIGYAYDVTTSRLRKYSMGSHEIMIGYDFRKKPQKDKSASYF